MSVYPYTLHLSDVVGLPRFGFVHQYSIKDRDRVIGVKTIHVADRMSRPTTMFMLGVDLGGEIYTSGEDFVRAYGRIKSGAEARQCA